MSKHFATFCKVLEIFVKNARLSYVFKKDLQIIYTIVGWVFVKF